MHEAEKVLSPEQQETYIIHLEAILKRDGLGIWTYRDAFVLVHATSQQRAEAFLRTIGKWEE